MELLADPTRRRIIGLLALRAMRPSTIATEIGLSRPATTRQLQLMVEAGLIRATRSYIDRRAILYSIDPRSHGPITAWLAGTEVGRPIKRGTPPGSAPGQVREPPLQARDEPSGFRESGMCGGERRRPFPHRLGPDRIAEE
jgi:DNA-binding transcriptional ArsR family regulator